MHDYPATGLCVILSNHKERAEAAHRIAGLTEGEQQFSSRPCRYPDTWLIAAQAGVAEADRPVSMWKTTQPSAQRSALKLVASLLSACT